MDRPTTADTTDLLRRDILAGIFAPGERLVEAALTTRYDCGRASIRAALVELATEGLIDREANRGATVRRITVADVIEITEARAALESLAAGHAATRATDAEREELGEIIRDMEAAVARDDSVGYSALNGRLHRLVHTASHHRVATELVENLRNRASHHHYRLALMPGRPTESLPQHAAIVDAIVAGDEAGARAAMSAHLQSVIDVLERWQAMD